MSKPLHFYKKALDDLPAASKGKRAYYLDSNKKSGDIKGFGLVVNDKGKKHFLLTQYFKRDKRTVRLRCGEWPHSTIDAARKKARGFQIDLSNGIHPTEQRNKDHLADQKRKQNQRARTVTLAEVLEKYLSDRDLKASTVADYKKVILEVWRDWMDKPLIQIDEKLVKDRYRNRLKESKARANYNMRVLRALFNFAREDIKHTDGTTIFERNPVDVISKKKGWHKVEPRDTKLSNSDFGKWLDALDTIESKVSAAYLKFLLFTGTRRSEAARLLVEDVDLENKRFTLRNTKNGRDVTLPMSDYVKNALLEIRSESKWVFPSPVNDNHLKDPRKAINRVAELSGKNFTLHDLRRTFINCAVRENITLPTIKALANHKEHDITGIYAGMKTDIDQMEKATEQVTSYILSKAYPEEGSVVAFRSRVKS
ncbi:MAG: tyrosine-type recombinase/integrase [Gammaproteobacteria bacterium]|nr:tyrosine-type recombinase/integrase [Gammaproteobacteria bacterium]